HPLSVGHPCLSDTSSARRKPRRAPWSGSGISFPLRPSATPPASPACRCHCTGTKRASRSARTSPPALATRPLCFAWPHNSKRRVPGRRGDHPSPF
ncbi:uncharacterized protein METZ01_LOCUS468607, partial [marine metagenome]